MLFKYALRKLIFRRNETLPSAGKLFIWQFSWIIPYLLVANYLERNLFPLRLLCYTQYESLNVPHGEKVNLNSCLQQFFLSSKQEFNERKKCLYEEPIRVLITPKISHNLDRMSIVRNAPSAHEYRNYVRETWKSDMEPDIPVIFVLGTDGYNVEKEAAIYHDIIQFDFIDSYFNLTLKITLVYKYFFGKFPDLQEIVMINDDAIANATAIKKMSRLKGATLRGKVSRGYPRLFLNSLLWYVPYDMYPKLCYPPFIQGSGVIVTRKAAQRIVDGICSLPRFNLDDVFMGILASCLSINMEHSDGFDEHDSNNSFIIFHYQWSRYSVPQLNFLYHKTIRKKQTMW
uniref:Hexosyltransferase n=1 Tax=Elaeophora elaphi TaxID=1147741 RepID=A0A0R3RTW0_9BILA